MNCQQARNLFDAHLNGELSGSLETELAAHRLRCSVCRQQLALLEVAGHVLRSEDRSARLGGDFTDRLLACLDEAESKRAIRRAWLVRIGGGLAAAACLTLLVGYLTRPEPRVAPYVSVAPSPVPAQPEAPPAMAVEEPLPPADVPAGPELDEVTDLLQTTVESSLLRTQRSSSSLMHLGGVTVQQMIDTLLREELRDPKLIEDLSLPTREEDESATHENDVEEL